MESKTERLQLQEKLGKQRANKWSQFLKLNSLGQWAIMHDTCYDTDEYWALVKAVLFANDAREYVVKIIKIKGTDFLCPKDWTKAFLRKRDSKYCNLYNTRSSSILGNVLCQMMKSSSIYLLI